MQTSVVQDFKTALKEQHDLLTWGMKVHASNHVMAGLHSVLVKKFEAMATLLSGLGVLAAATD